MSKAASTPASGRKRFLPPIGSVRYHLLLGAVAIFILGPLGGITAAYMNFSLGFFVGGQVLAGILGSVVTYGYGPEGKHGANYMQTMAASVASMSAMAVLIQAMVWLGLPIPPTWQLIVYFLCIGMFGVGVGMLYTPVLVDQAGAKLSEYLAAKADGVAVVAPKAVEAAPTVDLMAALTASLVAVPAKPAVEKPAKAARARKASAA